MFMVVFKCTRAERDGGDTNQPLPLDCYMVANKMFETIEAAQAYGTAMPLSRQVRVMDVASFRCPKTGQWITSPKFDEPYDDGGFLTNAGREGRS